MNESRITPGTLYKAVLLAFGLVVAGLIFQALVELVLAVMIVVIIALPLAAVATALQRLRIPRELGAVIALLIGLCAVALVIAAIVPVFTKEVNRFTNSLPSIVDSLRHRAAGLTGTSPSHVGQRIQSFVNGYTHHPERLLGPVASVGASIVAAVAALVVVLLTALYTAMHPEPLVSGLLRMFPMERRGRVEEVLLRLRTAYMGWLRGLVIGMIILGGLTYVGLRLVGLDFAAFFAVFTAVAMIVPYFGALVSSIPPIAYALTVSPGKALVVAAIYIGAHQLEGNVIQPVIVARAVKIHPAVVAVGVVAVGTLFGIVGLFIAIPIIATVKILVEELWMDRLQRRAAPARAEPPLRDADELVPAVAYRQPRAPGGTRP